LRAIDTQIEATRALIAKQERVRAGLMQDLFTRGVDEHGQLRPSPEEAPNLYHQTELGWLPKGWGTGSILRYCTEYRQPILTGPFGRTWDLLILSMTGFPCCALVTSRIVI
jgi:type I restriction enzyme S subunit